MTATASMSAAEAAAAAAAQGHPRAARVPYGRGRRPSARGVGAAEAEWRGLRVQHSRGWEHHASHGPEPPITSCCSVATRVGRLPSSVLSARAPCWRG